MATNFFLPFRARVQRVEPLEQPVWHATIVHCFSGNWHPVSMTQGPIWNARGWNRAWHLSVASLVACQLKKLCRDGHTPSFATWPSPGRPQNPNPKNQNPRSKTQDPKFGFRILDFEFWILDFGSWIFDFGLWILDCRSIRSFCGSPKHSRLDFGFRISILDLDFGFRILDFVNGLDFA